MKRFTIILITALGVTACGTAPSQDHRPAMRFDTAPVEFSLNPKMTSELNQSFTSNAAELRAAAKRIEAKNKARDAAAAAIAEAEAAEDAPTPLPVTTDIY